MTNRRLIRIKVLQLLYAYTKKESATIAEIEKDLFKSISKSTDLYYHVFLLLTEIQRKAFVKMDAARNRKNIATRELNPNTRFVNNPVIQQIAENRKFKAYVHANLVSLTDCEDIITTLYNRLLEMESFQNYMNKEEVTFDDHKKLVLEMVAELIAPSEEFLDAMEEKCIYWNDDFEFVLSMVYKTIKNIKEGTPESESIFISLYNAEEELEFAKTLFRKAILDATINDSMIEKYTINWEVDRISDIDQLILYAAITELKYFPSIPIKVTFDEYIEISKSYSTGKSGSFINGVLDKILAQLQENNEIQKTGRGLMEQSPQA